MLESVRQDGCIADQKILKSFSQINGDFAVLGGSFDPVHLGHIALAHKIKEKFALSKIVLMPTPQNPYKQASTALEDRVAMLKLAVEKEEDILISLAEAEKNSFTPTFFSCQQIEAQKQANSSFYWIIGEDCLSSIGRWDYADYLVSSYKLIVISRSEAGGEVNFKNYPEVAEDKAALLSRFTCESVGTFASSDVRARVAAGDLTEDLLPELVSRYIKLCGLYQYK